MVNAFIKNEYTKSLFLDELNRNSLNLIEQCIFILCLDQSKL